MFQNLQRLAKCQFLAPRVACHCPLILAWPPPLVSDISLQTPGAATKCGSESFIRSPCPTAHFPGVPPMVHCSLLTPSRCLNCPPSVVSCLLRQDALQMERGNFLCCLAGWPSAALPLGLRRVAITRVLQSMDSSVPKSPLMLAL